MSWVAPDPLLGRTLGEKYVIESKLGSGGFGAVYRARQIPVGRAVAVKIAFPPSAERTQVRERFLREAHALARMRCRAVAMFFDFGEEADGLLYMVQEFVDGVTLADVLEHERRIVPLRAIDVACAVLEALAEAHSLGIVHRDIKPANIMITRTARSSEQVKLLDFGLAKSWQGDDAGRIGTLTQSNRIPGTPAYMAPELWNQEPLTGAADLYALGVLLYRAVCGRLPFEVRTLPQLMQAHVNTPPPTPPEEFEVPPGLTAVILRAMAKNPLERFASAAEMDAALREALPEETARLAPIDMALMERFFAETSAESELLGSDVAVLNSADLLVDDSTTRNPQQSQSLDDEPTARSPSFPRAQVPAAPDAAAVRATLPEEGAGALRASAVARASQPAERAAAPVAAAVADQTEPLASPAYSTSDVTPTAAPSVTRFAVPASRRSTWPIVALFVVVSGIIGALVYVATRPHGPDPAVIAPPSRARPVSIGVETIRARPEAPVTAAPWSAPPTAAPPTAAPPTAAPVTATSRRIRRPRRRRPRPKAPATRAPSPAQQAAALARQIGADLEACRCSVAGKKLAQLAQLDAGQARAYRAKYQQACQIIGIGCLEDP